MPFLRTLASGLLGRRAARRLSRAIPNPFLRTATVAAVTALVPLVVNRLAERRHRTA
jgi:hypothetical protein